MITKEQALMAIDNLEDYSLMEVGVNPVGAMKVMVEYIEEMEAIKESAENVLIMYNEVYDKCWLYESIDKLEAILKEMK